MPINPYKKIGILLYRSKSGEKPEKGNGKPDNTAPVLPQGKAKAHAKTKSQPKKIMRSESMDNKDEKIRIISASKFLLLIQVIRLEINIYSFIRRRFQKDPLFRDDREF